MKQSSLNPWPLAIAGFFVVFISGLVTFIIFSTRHSVDLVQPDYYEQEIRYQQQVERVDRTRRTGQAAAVAYDLLQRCITVRLPAAHIASSSGLIHLYRPSDARLDQELPLAVNAEGVQRLDTTHLRAGLWKVRVHWTVAGQEFFVDQSLVIPASQTHS